MNQMKELFRWYFSKNALPVWCIFLLDCATVYLSCLLVYAINNGILMTLQQFWPLTGTLLIYIACYIVGFRLFHTYSGVIRFSSFVDLQRVGFAVITGFALIIIARLFGLNEILVEIRLRDIIFSALLILLLMCAMRVLVKYLYDTTYQLKQAKPIFIYGVKQGGISIAKSIRNQDPAKYVLSGFVSDITDIQHRRLMGVEVYANNDKLIDTMKKHHVRHLFVSPLKSESLKMI